MKAIRLHEFGPAENLRYEEVPDPIPGEGAVRIRVEAAGVHLVDTVLRAGTAGGMFAKPELPTIPGREVAGRVDAVGAGVDETWRGKRVVVHLGQAPGGYAELAVAKVSSLHELAEQVKAADAVAAIGTGRTAAGILEQAGVRADDVVLVTAAAGGIGSLIVQQALQVGATVIGLAGGAAKVAELRKLGAQYAVNYLDPEWAGQLDGLEISVVLDGVGGENGRRAFELLGTGGRLLMFGWSGGGPIQLTTDDLMARGLSATWAIGPKLMRRLRALEETALAEVTIGRWKILTTPYSLAGAAAAHTALENRNTVGKVVLVP